MNVRVGIIVALVAGGLFVFITSKKDLGDEHIIRARLSDVREMSIGTPVTIAGLRVGTIVKRRIGSGYAEIDIQFLEQMNLRTDATLYKKRTSILSGPSLEIDPGVSDSPLTGKYIDRVVETSPIGDTLHDISEALPAVRRGADVGVETIENIRARVNGPAKQRIEELERATVSMQENMHGSLQRMNEALKVAERISFNPEVAIEPRIRRAEELTELARTSLTKARTWVEISAEDARQSVDDTQIDWSPYATPMRDIDEGKGTLGVLLNSSEVHDDLVEITREGRAAMRALVNWQMHVGVRSEVGIQSGGTRTYVTLKAGRTNRYYYIELLTASNGGRPSVGVEYDPATDSWDRDITIRSDFKVTAQYARKFGPTVLRYGIKESSFGFGTDFELIDERLTLSADIFEFNQNDKPHLKIAASYRLFGQLYVLAGLDDVLNQYQRIDAIPDMAQPRGLRRLYWGRDFFLGGSLQFNDKDLATLLRYGGSALAGFVN